MAQRRGIVRSAARTIGRTAAIAGTATAVSGRVAHHQLNKFAKHNQRQNVVAEPSAFHGSNDVVGQLQQLADLRASGTLTEKEFVAAKTKLLRE
jgi:hypothetical protein